MQLPDKFGKYEVQGIIGRGAAGTVYLGRDPVLARSVAIKVIPLEIVDDYGREQYARFKREAQAVGRMHHGRIVAVYDYGETDHHAYIVMELLEGGSLKARLEQANILPLADVQSIMESLLDALRHSHQNGVVHRDIKPANVVFNRAGDPKITDFGIARLDSGAMTVHGSTLGTPAYMSPEQVKGETADARSDLYSAGVMMFEMLSGRKPFEGSAASVMHKIIYAPVPLLSDLSLPVRRQFDSFLGRALAKAPDDRFQSAGEMWEALKAAFASPEQRTGMEPDNPENTETLVRPLRAWRSDLDPLSKEATAVQRPLPVATPARPAAARQRAATKLKPPLLAAALLASAVLGGVAWLVLTSPAQRPTAASTQDGAVAQIAGPSPAASVPASAAVIRPNAPMPDKSTPADPATGWRSAAAAIVATAPCSLLRSDVTSNGDVAVTGITGLADMLETEVSASLRRAMAEEFSVASINWRVTHIAGPYCSVLSAWRQFVAGPGDVEPSLTISPSPAGSQLRVTAAGPMTTFLVDRFMANGKVEHLKRDDASSPKRAANPIPLLSEGEAAGTVDLIVVFTASTTLSLAPRPRREDTEGYVAELRATAERARKSGARIMAAAIPTSTPH